MDDSSIIKGALIIGGMLYLLTIFAGKIKLEGYHLELVGEPLDRKPLYNRKGKTDPNEPLQVTVEEERRDNHEKYNERSVIFGEKEIFRDWPRNGHRTYRGF